MQPAQLSWIRPSKSQLKIQLVKLLYHGGESCRDNLCLIYAFLDPAKYPLSWAP